MEHAAVMTALMLCNGIVLFQNRDRSVRISFLQAICGSKTQQPASNNYNTKLRHESNNYRMIHLRDAAFGTLFSSWLVFSGLLAWNHIRVRRQRRELQIAEERPAIRNPRSMYGLFLEGLSFLIAFTFRERNAAPCDIQCSLSITFGILSIVLLATALRHLGLEWRIKAVVTEDHHLVTTGPYSIIRHPIFTALFALLLSTAFLITQIPAAVVAAAIYLLGTEIRIRAEDGLLAQRFGPQFEDYRTRVAAYVPFLR